MTNSPIAAEEIGHIWIKTENGAVNLTMDIAALVRKAVEDGQNFTIDEWNDALATETALSILALPHIKAALDQYNRTIVPSADVGEMRK